LKDHTVTIHSFDEFIPALDNKNLILAPFCGEIACEEEIKKKSTR
jgi:prolyl-tRNA synthetase